MLIRRDRKAIEIGKFYNSIAITYEVKSAEGVILRFQKTKDADGDIYFHKK